MRVARQVIRDGVRYSAHLREIWADAQGVVVRADAGECADHEATVNAALDAYGGLDIADPENNDPAVIASAAIAVRMEIPQAK